MKRALLLTYYVPPRAAIASVRIGHLLEHLPRYGWEVVPVTPDFGDTAYGANVRTTSVVDFKAPVRRILGVKAHESTHERLGFASTGVRPPSLMRRAVALGYNVAEFANTRFGWLVPGSHAVARMLRNERFDAVISTSPPSATHLVAARVHGHIPWIADLRDPWHRNDEMVFPAPLAALDRALEPRTFRTAAALTIVSEPLAARLRVRYPSIPVFAIPNAFSAREWDGVAFARPERATFMHPGQLYEGRRDPRPFFAALASLIADGSIEPGEIEVNFYGCTQPWLRAQIAAYGLDGIVRTYETLAREKILALERASSRLLLFLWDGPDEEGTYTGKLFEYLGARRKIIAVGGAPRMVIDDALARSGAGARYRDTATLRAAILDVVREHRAGFEAMVPSDAVAPFESVHLARQFARVLDACTNSDTPLATESA